MNRLAFVLGTGVNLLLIGLVLAYGIVHWSSVGRATAAESSAVGNLLAFALLCGAASFATIEALKRILGLRGFYQARQTRLWLQHRGYDIPDNEFGSLIGEKAWNELLDAMGVDPKSVTGTFNLPNEQLAALVSSAADVALSTSYRSSSGPDDGDSRTSGVAFLATLARLPPKVIREASAAMGARSREDVDQTTAAVVAQRVRSGVDQLQISLGARWRRYVQSAALWIAGAYGIALVDGRGSKVVDDGHLVLVAVIIGGPLAWFLRDLAALVERSRR